MTTEAVYFKKLLDEGKINKEDALAFYMDKCKELEEELKATRKALKNLVDLFDGIELRYR